VQHYYLAKGKWPKNRIELIDHYNTSQQLRDECLIEWNDYEAIEFNEDEYGRLELKMKYNKQGKNKSKLKLKNTVVMEKPKRGFITSQCTGLRLDTRNR